MKIKTEKIIEVQEWDRVVRAEYGRPYSLQQQDGCHSRGLISLTVPDPEAEDFDCDAIPEKVNGSEEGVSFDAWKARDPKAPLNDPEEIAERESVNGEDTWGLNLFWARNFYPNLQVVANDLHARGKLEAGEYRIDIDW
jgi:hypothetical protein